MSDTVQKRPRGRPPSIDRTEILERATQAFWRLGYDGASLGALTEATGVSRPTLYAMFGDKDALFDAVLDHYGSTVASEPMRAFLAEPEIGAAVEAFLRVSAEGNTQEDAPSGCLIACCAATTAESTPELRTKLHKQSEEVTAILADRFAKEVEAGHLRAEPSPHDRAVLLGDFMRAQAVRARSGASRDEILADLWLRAQAVIS